LMNSHTFSAWLSQRFSGRRGAWDAEAMLSVTVVDGGESVVVEGGRGILRQRCGTSVAF
jgi:hypothetical protein